MRILLIVSYFGKLPWYFNLWKKSAELNAGIDFLLITDSLVEVECGNIKIMQINIDEYCYIFSRKTGYDFKPRSYHKLCDFRPFYGLVLEDKIKGYNYWGYSDMDLIYGNLNPLLDVAKLGYDVISPWIYTVGHCTVVKNTFANNRICLNIDGIEERLKERGSTFMDEGAFSQASLKTPGVKIYCINNVNSELSQNSPFLGVTVQSDFKFSRVSERCAINYKDNELSMIFRNGTVKKVLYFHFMGVKNKSIWLKIPDKEPLVFGFNESGFKPTLIEVSELSGIRWFFSFLVLVLPKRIYFLLRMLVPILLVKKILSFLNR
jgi:hypothetical protein